MLSVIYFDESASNIVSQSGSNDIKIDSETNAVFNLLKIFCSYLIHYYETSLINFVKDAAISAKNLMNC